MTSAFSLAAVVLVTSVVALALPTPPRVIAFPVRISYELFYQIQPGMPTTKAAFDL